MDGYEKLVHPIIGYEVVIDKINNKIITDPLNVGTYNFYNNDGINDLIGGTMSHIEFDVTPYMERGNAPYPSDPTTKQQRIERNLFYLRK